MCQCFSLSYSPSRICVSLPSPPILSRRNLRSTASAMHSNPSPPLPSQHHRQTQEQSRQQAIEYHDQTKHSLTTGYARGPRGLDWANQPNPFLRFLSAPLHPLLHFPPLPGDSPLYHSLFSSFPSPPHSVSRASLSHLLYNSLSLSAWKTTSFFSWSLCINPSSGNLHPTKAHLLWLPLPDGDSPFSSSSFLAHCSPKTTPTSSMPASTSLPSSSITAATSFSSLSPPSSGARPGSTVSVPSVTATTTSVMPLPRLPSVGAPASSTASATTTSTSSSASTTPTLRRLPSSPSASFVAASPRSSPSIRTAPSSSSPSAPRPYRPCWAGTNGPCRASTGRHGPCRAGPLGRIF